MFYILQEPRDESTGNQLHVCMMFCTSSLRACRGCRGKLLGTLVSNGSWWKDPPFQKYTVIQGTSILSSSREKSRMRQLVLSQFMFVCSECLSEICVAGNVCVYLCVDIYMCIYTHALCVCVSMCMCLVGLHLQPHKQTWECAVAAALPLSGSWVQNDKLQHN